MKDKQPMTVGQLVKELMAWPQELPVVVSIVPGGDADHVSTFITDPFISKRGLQQTYMGDQDVLRIQIEQDEP